MAGSDNIFREACSKRRRTLNSSREKKLTYLPTFFAMQREEDVFNALEAIEADVTLARPVRWKKLLPVIRGMTVNDETAPDCLNVAKALLGLFERYQCRDTSVKSEVFRLLLSLTDFAHPILNEHIKFTNIFLSPYGEEATEPDLVFRAAMLGNLSLLKLQLKFGLGMMVNSSFPFKRFDTVLHAWLYNFDDDTNENSIENPRGRYQILRGITREIIEKNIRCNFNPESMKRLGLVFRMLVMRIMMKLSPDYTEYFIECYRLIFDSIPAAFVTSVEVKASLEKLLPASCSRLTSRIAEDFKNLLPDMAEVLQPRSLKHLCRIQVRQSLRVNLNLPHGVSSLPLPTSLKEYVILNDDGDYSVVIRTRHLGTIFQDSLSVIISIPERDDCVTSFLKNL